MNKNTNGKSGYEIRLAILEMANGLARDYFFEKLNTLKENDAQKYDKALRLSERSGAEMMIPTPKLNLELIDELSPKESDIIARAKELYEFVENG